MFSVVFAYKQLTQFSRFINVFVYVLIFLTAFVFRFSLNTIFVMNDEVGAGYRGYGYLAWGYFDTAQVFHNYLSNAELHGLFNWSLTYNANYPMVPLLMSVAMLLLKSSSLEVARIPIIVLGSLVPVLISSIANYTISRKVGVYAGFMAALDPVLITYSRVSYLDIPSQFFFIISLLTFYRGLTKRSLLSVSIAGFCFGLSVLSKIMAWMLLPLFLVSLFLRFIINRECFVFLLKTFGIFLISILLTCTLLFPWIGYSFVTGQYIHWIFSIISESSRPIARVAPPSFAIFLLGKLTPVEVFTTIIGVSALILSMIRKPNFSNALVVSWFLVTYAALEILPVKLNHYLVHLIPPLLLFSGQGIWICEKLIQRFAAQYKVRYLFIRFLDCIYKIRFPFDSSCSYNIKILNLIMVSFILSLQFIIMISHFPYFSLYYNRFMVDPIKVFEIQGEEGIPLTINYIKNHAPLGSTIVVAGQVHLFHYYLPDYKIMSLGEFQQCMQEQLEILCLADVKYLVIQSGFMQLFGNSSPILIKLSNFSPDYVCEILGYKLVLVYNISSIFPPPTTVYK